MILSLNKDQLMKNISLSAIFFIAMAFSACSDDTTQNNQTEEQTVMATDEPEAGAVVIETPVFTSVAEPMQRNISQLLDEYLVLKDALVASDPAKAKKYASSILTMANAMPVATLQLDQKSFAEEHVNAIQQAATALANSTEIEEQRRHLEPLSEATFALTKAFGATDQKLYYQHCPMALNDKGAYWLSTNQEIRNPYFGESMLKCGTNEEIYTGK
jgi:hypothetical protein